jgi:inosine-uridine nucleoside N-ribohydrolase
MGLPLKEVDDGLTLLYLLGEPQIEILGITTTFGNGTIDQVFNQTLKLTEQLKINVPVFRGEGQPRKDPDTPAAEFLVKMVNKYPGEISLLATGPVGNLHTASLLEPGFFNKVKRVVCMGGYLNPFKLGYRNLQELNFSADPQAALSLLHAPCPVTVFPGSACLDAPYYFHDIWSKNFWSIKMKVILTQWLIAFGIYCGVNSFYLWDLLPAVYLTDPDVFELISFKVSSSLTDIKKGMLIVGDESGLPEITLGKQISDRDRFFTRLESAWRKAAEIYHA